MMSYLWILLLGSLLATSAKAQDELLPAEEGGTGAGATPAPEAIAPEEEKKADTYEGTDSENTAQEVPPTLMASEPVAEPEGKAQEPVIDAEGDSKQPEAEDKEPVNPVAGDEEPVNPVAGEELVIPAEEEYADPAAGEEEHMDHAAGKEEHTDPATVEEEHTDHAAGKEEHTDPIDKVEEMSTPADGDAEQRNPAIGDADAVTPSAEGAEDEAPATPEPAAGPEDTNPEVEQPTTEPEVVGTPAGSVPKEEATPGTNPAVEEKQEEPTDPAAEEGQTEGNVVPDGLGPVPTIKGEDKSPEVNLGFNFEDHEGHTGEHPGKDHSSKRNGRVENVQDANKPQAQEGNSSSLAGILATVGVALVGAVTGYFTYQKKKLCFKNRQEADPEAARKADAAEAQSDPQVLSNLLNSS